MNIAAASSVPLQQVSQAAIKPPAHAPDASFQSSMSKFLKDVNGQQLQSDQAVQQLVTGQSDNVHNVVLSMAKADLSFRLMLEIRNRLIDSYQEVMRMQV